MSTFTSLATQFPTLKFVIAEYGPEQRAANDIMFNLPNQAASAPTTGSRPQAALWNHRATCCSARSGNRYTAHRGSALYDQMKIDYASRL